MKLVIITILFLNTFFSLSQSKKEQIEILKSQLDSIKIEMNQIKQREDSIKLKINSFELEVQKSNQTLINYIKKNNDSISKEIDKIKMSHSITLQKIDSILKPKVFPYKISRELTTEFEEFEWKALCKIPIYKTDAFNEIIGSISLGEKFKMLDDYYLIEQPLIAKISNIDRSNEECAIKDLKIGDEIKLLIGYGECQWSFLQNDILKFATFGFDAENKKLIDCEYDGCTKIRGEIVSENQKKSFIVKIKYKSTVGWIKYIIDDIYKYEFTNFIQTDF